MPRPAMLESLSVVISLGFGTQGNMDGVFPVARPKPLEEGAEGGHAGGNEGEVVLDAAARVCCWCSFLLAAKGSWKWRLTTKSRHNIEP